MTRALVAVDPAHPQRVLDALRDALTGDGPAIFPGTERPASSSALPTSVEQRVALVVETSGSTGRPKRVVLSADAVLASAAASESALGGPGHWLLALPVHYIAGLNVLARSITAQTEPAFMAPGHFTVEGFVDAAASLPDGPGPTARFVSLVPAQLARLIGSGGQGAVDSSDVVLEVLRRFDRILVGGQATPPALVARALELGLNLTRTYGSAETCGGCVYDGVPIGDAAVRTVATSGAGAGMAPSSAGDGRVELGGPMLAEGYLDDPARTDAAFHTDDGRRWYRTDDRGLLVDGALRVTGRIDDVIVSGGVKVSLGEIELVVRGMPGQADAVVVAAPSEWGESAVVVTEVAVELEAVRVSVTGELGPAASPARIVLVDRVPRTSTGKPDRVAAAALAGAAAPDR